MKPALLSPGRGGQQVAHGKTRSVAAVGTHPPQPPSAPAGAKDWQSRPLREMCSLISGRHIEVKDYNTESRGIGYLTGPSDFGPVNPVITKWTEHPQAFAESGDILITVKGAGVGKINLLDVDKVAISRQLMAVRVKDANPSFIHAFLGWQFEHFQSLGSGATIPGISREDVLDLQIPLPPLPEQHRLVTLLDQAFAAIATAQANTEKNLQNAHALFESHLQSVFSRHNGWTEERLGDISTFSSGGTPSKSNASYWKGNIPWISGRDMKSSRLSDAALHISKQAVDESSTRMAPAGSLLILVRGMGLAHGAQIAELMVPCAFNQDIRAIHPAAGILPRFLVFALRIRINNGENILSNAAHGTLKIDTDELKKVEVPTPPLQDQQNIVAKIDALSAETQRLTSLYQQKLTALAALKKSFLHQAFTGQL